MIIPPTEDAILSLLFSHFPNASIGGIRFVGRGSVNEVYGAKVDGRELVVRLADVRYRSGEHEKEAWCFERARAAGIPGPETIALGIDDQTVYMIQEFMQGVRGDDGTVDSLKLWKTLGRYAKIIHGIETSDFPERSGKSDGWAEVEWERFLAYGLASLTPEDRLIELGVYAPEQQDDIRAIFEGIQRLSFKFSLVHDDLSEKNVILSADGAVSLLDWGCACVSVSPHVEMLNILRWFPSEDSRFQAFLAGYELTEAEFALLYPQIQDYALLKSFDLVRWAIDRRPEEIEAYAEEAKRTLQARSTSSLALYRIETL